jgi:hypothetical protein
MNWGDSFRRIEEKTRKETEEVVVEKKKEEEVFQKIRALKASIDARINIEEVTDAFMKALPPSWERKVEDNYCFYACCKSSDWEIYVYPCLKNISGRYQDHYQNINGHCFSPSLDDVTEKNTYIKVEKDRYHRADRWGGWPIYSKTISLKAITKERLVKMLVAAYMAR